MGRLGFSGQDQPAGGRILGPHPFHRHPFGAAALHIEDMADVKPEKDHSRRGREQQRPRHAGIEQTVIDRNQFFSCHGSPSHSLVGGAHRKARLRNVAFHLGDLLADGIIFRRQSRQGAFDLLQLLLDLIARYAKALELYKRVFALNPDNKIVAVCIGNTLTLMKEREKAYNYFEKALKMDGDNYKAYICYSIALSEFREYDIAIEMYKRAIELQPKEVNAYLLLANLYTNLNRLDDAMVLYKEVLKFAPNDALTYMFMGNAHYLKGEIEKAIAAYRAAIKIEPDNDEHKLVYIQVMDEYIDKKRNGEIEESESA